MRISDWSSDVCSSDLVLFVALSSERQDFHTLADVSGRSTGRAVDEAPRAGERGEHRTVLDRRRERAAVAQLGPQIIRARAVGGQVFAAGRGDRKSAASGKRVSVRVVIGGRRIIKKKKRHRVG